MTRRISCLLLAGVLMLGFAGCAPEEADVPSDGRIEIDAAGLNERAAAPAEADAPRYSGPLQYVDVTAESGIAFRHNSGAAGKKYLPETMGSGCAFLDYNNDGWQDVLFVNSTSWPGDGRGPTYPALYRNERNGTFKDVTAEVGLNVEMYGLGCAIADFDADGFADVYITCVGRNHLFRNMGGRRFVDVGLAAGVADPGFSAGAAWVDYDRDGSLDLFVCNYVEWTPETDKFCALDGKNKSYCTPEVYTGQSNTLYRNRGNGTFEDVTKRAGLFDPTGKSLGVALLDYDEDGWMDLFVSNDTQPNKLYRNKGDGTFEDAAPLAGVAFGDTGKARAGMGTDAADYDGSGRPGIIVGNFSDEMMALYKNEGGGLFVDDAQAATIGRASASSVTFAAFFLDYDLDGLLDVFAANGHVADDIERVRPALRYAQPAHLFRNLGRGRFDHATSKVGQALGAPVVGRGAAYGDYDNDGDLDLLVTANNGPARLLRNDGGNQNNFARLVLVGSGRNRNAIGARVTLTSGGRKTWRMVKTGSSYLSQSELPVTFGLGRAEGPLTIDVVWPDGTSETIQNVPINHVATIVEGKGLAGAVPARL